MQNDIKGIHILTWKRPRDILAGSTVFEVSTASAEINFNADTVGMLIVLAKLGITPGSNCIDYFNQRDHARIYQMNRKEMDSVKHQLLNYIYYSICHFVIY